MIKSLSDHKIVQMSLGFQHCLYLTDKGEVFGLGRNNRYQLGKKKDEDSKN